MSIQNVTGSQGKNPPEDELKAGTGFMQGLAEAIKKLESQGYTDNLSAKYDHLECRSGEVKINPQDFKVDKMIRFENTSDPDDQSIIYAISSESQDVKGVYVEGYGINQDGLSPDMIQRLKEYPH